jgi:LPS-assembly protein
MTWTYLANNGGFLRASAGESFHIAGRNSFTSTSGLDGSKSDLVAALTIQPWENFGLSYQMRVEEDFSAINRHEARASLTFDDFSLQASYLKLAAEPSYGRVDDIHEVATESKLALNNGWFLLNGLNYDLQTSTLRKAKLGFEMDCDCMNFQMAYTYSKSKDSDRDHRFMFSLDLATIGSTKTSFGF